MERLANYQFTMDRKPCLKTLGSLQRIEGNASFRYVLLEDLGELEYQEFVHPVYEQNGKHPFVANCAAVDMLFNLGINRSRQVFWENVNLHREF